MKGEIPKIIEALYKMLDELSGGEAYCTSVDAKEDPIDISVHAIMPDDKEYIISYYEDERSQ